MDCFYAAVEMRDRPDWVDRPLAVGGRPEGRGVIATCNYPARKFGVRSALSSREAVRRCPDLIIVPTRFQKYKEVSAQIRAIFSDYTDLIEPLSLDEAYLDLSDNQLFDGSASLTAFAIRSRIREELNLTASAGIAPNKFLAKIASDWKKPDNQYTIRPQDVADFIVDLPLKKIPGVGKATLASMQKRGFETCGQLQKCSIDELVSYFGSFGVRLYDLSRGIDHSKVKTSRTRKSISVETTLIKDLLEWSEIKTEVEKLYQELTLRMQRSKIANQQIKSIGVKFKNSEFQINSRERAIDISLENFINLAQDHFLDHGEPIRLIGLGAKLDVKESKKQRQQLNLF